MLCDPVSRSSPALQQELAGNGDSSLCRSTQRTVAVKKTRAIYSPPFCRVPCSTSGHFLASQSGKDLIFWLAGGHLRSQVESICIACLALRPSPQRVPSAMCTSILLQLLGLSMLTFSDTFETARMYRRATARLRRDACTARMYLVATLLQHNIWV
jgi:hypothetical protein